MVPMAYNLLAWPSPRLVCCRLSPAGHQHGADLSAGLLESAARSDDIPAKAFCDDSLRQDFTKETLSPSDLDAT